jgi:hypothetical protein
VRRRRLWRQADELLRRQVAGSNPIELNMHPAVTWADMSHPIPIKGRRGRSARRVLQPGRYREWFIFCMHPSPMVLDSSLVIGACEVDRAGLYRGQSRINRVIR